MNSMKDLFLLDPDIIFLNHGSFGATPRAVFEDYQAWQRRLERQPVLFLGRELPALDRDARIALGAYLHAAADDLTFVPNATYAVNLVARSLHLQPGDEILASDHEYGACDYAWEFLCARQGAVYRRQPVPLPVQSEHEIVEALWSGVNNRTRAIFLSHITSPTALRFPVEAICARARQAGILTLIDGAHTPGQLDLNLEAIGADFYTGNCHKWMMAPKGAGFLYARKERQAMVEPLVVSWGFHATPETTSGSRFIDYTQWTGTHDPSAALSVPIAIQFLHDHSWEAVRMGCHNLLSDALQRIQALTGLPPFYPLDQSFFVQMAACPLPQGTDVKALKDRLYTAFRIEIPVHEWNGQPLLRISVQGYNSQEDIDALIFAMEKGLFS